MKYNREEAIKETLKWEGGYCNDEGDPGGPTKYGITIFDVRKYVKKGATAEDVKKLTLDQAVKIYQDKYWKTQYYDCDLLAAGVDLSVFDFGVNSGPSRAKRYLDQAAGGPDVETISRLNELRLGYLKGLASLWPRFGVGWGRRVKGIKAKSLELNKRKAPVGAEHGVFASITAFIASTWVWLKDHALEITLIGIPVAIALYFIIKWIKKVSK